MFFWSGLLVSTMLDVRGGVSSGHRRRVTSKPETKASANIEDGSGASESCSFARRKTDRRALVAAQIT